ncbi:unnamed protein product [Protopolystoma xenopodis]|uniref:Uncharacterized protein n=1 Tax=Protopolystoma xenopodis TaxID=117903 RepID=A0A448WLG1_9PLAT|nr:unnamed protein product [Protopolystoma xenopodis]
MSSTKDTRSRDPIQLDESQLVSLAVYGKLDEIPASGETQQMASEQTGLRCVEMQLSLMGETAKVRKTDTSEGSCKKSVVYREPIRHDNQEIKIIEVEKRTKWPKNGFLPQAYLDTKWKRNKIKRGRCEGWRMPGQLISFSPTISLLEPPQIPASDSISQPLPSGKSLTFENYGLPTKMLDSVAIEADSNQDSSVSPSPPDGNCTAIVHAIHLPNVGQELKTFERELAYSATETEESNCTFQSAGQLLTPKLNACELHTNIHIRAPGLESRPKDSPKALFEVHVDDKNRNHPFNLTFGPKTPKQARLGEATLEMHTKQWI